MLDTTRTQTFACPSPDDLSAFHDGKLPQDKLEAVAGHVEACDTCIDRLSTFSGDGDRLVRELRDSSEPEPIAPEEASRATAIAGSVAVPSHAPAPPTAEAPRPGAQLGPYELVELLGEGGM